MHNAPIVEGQSSDIESFFLRLLNSHNGISFFWFVDLAWIHCIKYHKGIKGQDLFDSTEC